MIKAFVANFSSEALGAAQWHQFDPLPAETTMLIQILTHTPLYVWAILALLVYRGVVAMREREVRFGKLFIVPLMMLALSLHDIAMKFGFDSIALPAWAAGAALTSLLVLRFGSDRIIAGTGPGLVRIGGSAMPLAMMMATFLTKYAASVSLAILPHLGQKTLFAAAVCALFGVLNGYFLGGLARDVCTFQNMQHDRLHALAG